MHSRRCLVLGSGGFIGRHVMHDAALLRTQLGARAIPAPAGLDIRDPIAVRTLVDHCKPDYLIHLAAATFVPDSVTDPTTNYQINFSGTLNVLTALANAGFAGRMLFVSSAEVYGAVDESDLPVREAQPFAPRTPYAVSKAAGELLCLQHHLARGLDVCIVRPFNVIGPGQSSKFAVSSFARQIARLEAEGGGALEVGNLNVTRDFVDVDDAVAAFLAILSCGHTGEAYNLCSGEETAMATLLERLRALASVPVRIAVDQARVRPAEQRRVRGDHAKLTDHTGWRPQRRLPETLTSILSDWRTRMATRGTGGRP
jgi:GDP-4-dehydro-6-deoxy-D-mannose reductase